MTSTRDFLSLPDGEKWKCIDDYIRTLNDTMATYHHTYMAWVVRENALNDAQKWPERMDRTYPEWLEAGYRVWQEMDSLHPTARQPIVQAVRGSGPTRGAAPTGDAPRGGGSTPPPPPPPPDWP